MTGRVRLRTILLSLNLFVLIVPLAGVYAFHIYENQLIRQVESELIAQGAYASAFYQAAIHQQPDQPCASDADPGSPANNAMVTPVLNLAEDTVFPARPDALVTQTPADRVAQGAGQAVYPVLASAARLTLAGFRIVDCHGIVVAGRSELGRSLSDIPEVQTALLGHYRAVLRLRETDPPHPPLASISRGATIRVFVAMPITDNSKVIGAILLSRTPRNILESLYDERRAVLSAAAIVLTLTCLMALLTSQAISRPIAALRDQAQRIGRGDRDVQPLLHPVTFEIGALSQSLAAMGQRLGERGAYIRDFATHMSHEFKTPLTAIQGALELIQDHRAVMDSHQLERFLSNAIKDTERLKLLVARLLDLAQADMMQPRDESCDLGRIVQEIRSDYGDRVVIRLDAQQAGTILPMPEEIVHAVLTTLVSNSVQHGATEVVVGLQTGPEGSRLEIEDNGKGISSANAEKLFVPFFTTKRDTGGTGLGLVILRSLLTAYRATITYQPGLRGAKFVIVVPGNTEIPKPLKRNLAVYGPIL